MKESGFALSVRYSQRPWIISKDRQREAVTCGHVRVKPTIKSNGIRFAWGERVSPAAGEERDREKALASIQRTNERTCRHRRSYIEISAKETKARETKVISQGALEVSSPARSLSVFFSFFFFFLSFYLFINRRRSLCARFRKWFPIYISTDLLLS